MRYVKTLVALTLFFCTLWADPLDSDVQNPAIIYEEPSLVAGVATIIVPTDSVIVSTADVETSIPEFHSATYEDVSELSDLVSEDEQNDSLEDPSDLQEQDEEDVSDVAEELIERDKYESLYANSIISSEYLDMIVEICESYNLDPYLIAAQCECESSGNPNDISSANAVGLMQIIKKYHRERMGKLGVDDLYDPYSNLLVGIDFMSELLSKYDTKTALMCYNEGEFSGARSRAAEGNYSSYSKKVVKRASALRE